MLHIYELLYTIFSSVPFLPIDTLIETYGLAQSDFSFLILLLTLFVVFLLFFVPLKFVLKLKNKFERII